MSDTVRIALVSDIHYTHQPMNPVAKLSGAQVLEHAVNVINQSIRPDATLILGDLLNDPDLPDAPDLLKELATIIDRLDSPSIVIPGNHDLPPDLFYQIIPTPPDVLDINGTRIVWFIDPEAPDYHAQRTDANFARMRQVCCEFAGPIVAMQHVPVVPPAAKRARFNYTNVDDIVNLATELDITLHVAGHLHPGVELTQFNRGWYYVVKALREPPYNFAVATVSGGHVDIEEHTLAVDE